MDIASARGALADAVLSSRPPEELIRSRAQQIHQAVLAHSPHIRQADFTAIHPRDLELLFRRYDERFFDGRCQQALDGRKLRFRLSSRMTRTGGTTTRFTLRTGEVSYEIAIASSMLFHGLDRTHRNVSVAGLECPNRLEALQRIFEHEMVHLVELLCWETSDCSATRFQEIAGRLFLHRDHTHSLVTHREKAVRAGILRGSLVTFLFEGRRLTGRVNRITKRATVLVEHANGQAYSDGLRYKTYYVPIRMLEPVAAHLDPRP